MSKACYLIFWHSACLLSVPCWLFWGHGPVDIKASAIFTALLVDRRLHVLLLWTWDHLGESTVPWLYQRDTRGAGHRVCFDTLLGWKYLVRILVWLVISFRNMESSTVCWRSALLATASYPSLYPLSVPTLTSNPYVHVVYSWKVSPLELFPEDTKEWQWWQSPWEVW